MPLPNAFPLFVDPYLRDCGVAVTVTPSPGPRLPKHRDRMAEAVTVPVHENTAAGFVPTAV